MNKRKGNLQDLQPIKELAVAEWSQFKNELSAENWEKFYATLVNENVYKGLLTTSETIVFENDEKEIIGFVFYFSSGHPTAVFSAQESYFRMLTVSSNYAGHKIGTMLVASCIEKAKLNHETAIAVETTEMNASARRLYEKLGFKMVQVLATQFGKEYYAYKLNL